MALFAKQTQGTPVQQVLDMRQQGQSDNQIVQGLQSQGFSTQQIFDAMSQADLAGMASPTGALPIQGLSPEEMPDAPPVPPGGYGEGQNYQQQYPSEPGNYPQYGQPQQNAEQGMTFSNEEKIHEIAEAVINEKWDELIKEVQKIIVWKERVETSLQNNGTELDALKEEFKQLRQGIMGKISEYDENIRSVGSELKAVQKVFKDVIPSFTENVAELSRVTKTIKKGGK